MERELLVALAERHGADLRFAEPMARHTTLGIGGEAPFFLHPRGWTSVPDLLRDLWGRSIPFRVLAGGSKLLVEGGPLEYGVVSLSRIGGKVRWKGALVEADADVPLPALCAESVRRGLQGIEGLGGIPGTVGGALIMNAGAFGAEISGALREVRLIEKGRGLTVRPASDFSFAYRRSTIGEAGIVAGCTLELSPADGGAIRRLFEECRARRKATQPWKSLTAGSVFKNPKGDSAGRLLDSLGFKGKRKGQAGFSDLHANFLVNHGGASFEEAFGLCEEAREAVIASGLSLEYELQIWRRT